MQPSSPEASSQQQQQQQQQQSAFTTVTATTTTTTTAPIPAVVAPTMQPPTTNSATTVPSSSQQTIAPAPTVPQHSLPSSSSSSSAAPTSALVFGPNGMVMGGTLVRSGSGGGTALPHHHHHQHHHHHHSSVSSKHSTANSSTTTTSSTSTAPTSQQTAYVQQPSPFSSTSAPTASSVVALGRSAVLDGIVGTAGVAGDLDEDESTLQQQLAEFWTKEMSEIQNLPLTDPFKGNHELPLARIKKIMKADEDVKMISAEAPVLFAKACELFIMELTIRAWAQTEQNKRKTLQKSDIATAISRTDMYDFLIDIVPRETPNSTASNAESASTSLPPLQSASIPQQAPLLAATPLATNAGPPSSSPSSSSAPKSAMPHPDTAPPSQDYMMQTSASASSVSHDMNRHTSGSISESGTIDPTRQQLQQPHPLIGYSAMSTMDPLLYYQQFFMQHAMYSSGQQSQSQSQPQPQPQSQQQPQHLPTLPPPPPSSHIANQLGHDQGNASTSQPSYSPFIVNPPQRRTLHSSSGRNSEESSVFDSVRGDGDDHNHQQ